MRRLPRDPGEPNGGYAMHVSVDSLPALPIRSRIMNRERTISRRCLATALAAVMLTLSIVMPVLDRGDIADEPVAESEHVPAECLQGHDHSICTLVGSNHAAAAPASGGHQQQRLHRLASLTPRLANVRSAILEGPPSRAPPRV